MGHSSTNIVIKRSGVEDLERKIIRVQRSTRTLLPNFSKVHNNLRVKFKWYYFWHTLPQSQYVHWAILGLVILAATTTVLASFLGGSKQIEASTTTVYRRAVVNGDTNTFSGVVGGATHAAAVDDGVDGSSPPVYDTDETSYIQTGTLTQTDLFTMNSITFTNRHCMSKIKVHVVARASGDIPTTTGYAVIKVTGNDPPQTFTETNPQVQYLSTSHSFGSTYENWSYEWIADPYEGVGWSTEEINGSNIPAFAPTDKLQIGVRGVGGVVLGDTRLLRVTSVYAEITYICPPDRPAGTSLSNKTTTSMRFNWGNVTGEDGFNVEKATNGATWYRIATKAADVLYHDDAGPLCINTKYYYRVQSFLNEATYPWGGASNHARRTWASIAARVTEELCSDNGSAPNYQCNNPTHFPDVPLTDHNYREIEGGFYNSWWFGFSGDPNNFHPDKTSDRGTIAVVVARALSGSSVPDGGAQIFDDVPPAHWTYDYTNYAYRAGYLPAHGYPCHQAQSYPCPSGGTCFCPEDYETQDYVVKKLYSLLVHTKSTPPTEGYTLANTPGQPTVNTPTTTSLKITVNKNSNPDTGSTCSDGATPGVTQYAVYNDTLDQWVDYSDGLSNHASEVWGTYTQWGGASGKVSGGLTCGAPGPTYTYYVKACNGTNDGACSGSDTPTANSTTQSGTLSPCAPAAPTNTYINGATTSALTLNWANVTGETGYKVSSQTNCTGSWSSETDKSVDVVSHPYSSLTPNTSYCFRARACNGAECSGYVYTRGQTLAQRLEPKVDTLENLITFRFRGSNVGGLTTGPYDDDTGDIAQGTFTRNSADATYTADDGKLQSVQNTNDVRIEKASASDNSRSPGGGYRNEPSRTNLLTYSSFEAGSNPPTGWTNALLTSSAVAGGVQGTNYANLVTNGAGYNALYQAVSGGLTSGATYTLSVYAQYVSGLNGKFAIGVEGACGSYWSTDNTVASGSWQRITKTFTVSTTGACNAYIEPTFSTAQAATFKVDAIQLEQQTVAPGSTSYIPTTTASVARNADSLYFDNSGNINASAGTISFWAKPAWNSTDYNGTGGTYYGSIVDTGYSGTVGGKFIAFQMSSGGSATTFQTYQREAGGTFNTGLVNLSFSADQWMHIAVTYQTGGRYNFYVNGVYVGQGSRDLIDQPTTGNMVIGTWGDQFNGVISDLTIFNTVLSAESVQGIYNGYGPSNVRITTPPTVDQQLTVTWQDNSKNESATGGFTTQYKETGGVWSADQNENQNIVTHNQGSLNINKQYTFQLRANTTGYYSDWQQSQNPLGTAQSVYTLARQPASPAVYVNPADNPKTKLNVTVAANSNPDATNYRITRDIIPTGAFGTTAQDWTAHNNGDVVGNASLSENTMYCYKIRARNGDSVETNDSLRCASTRSTHLEPKSDVPNNLQSYIDTNGFRLRANASDTRGDSSESATFTRNDTNASFTGDDGKVYSAFNANEPRIEKVTDKEGGSNIMPGRAVRIEESRINQILYTSYEMDSNSDGTADGWTNYANAGATGTRTWESGGINGTYAQRFSRDSSSTVNTHFGVYQARDNIGLLGSTSYTFSAYVKPNSYSGNEYFRIYVTWRDSTPASLGSGFCTWNLSTLIQGQWQRVTCTKTSPANTVGIYNYISVSSAGADSGDVSVDGVQFETTSAGGASPFVTSYIPTTAVVATRAAETLTYPTSNNISATQGTLSFWIKPENATYDVGDTTKFLFGDSANHVIFYNPGNAKISVNWAYNAGQYATTAGLSTNWIHVVQVWRSDNSAQTYINGQSVGTGTHNATAFGTDFYVGSHYSLGRQVNSLISDVTVFNTALDGDQIKGIYNAYGPSKVAITNPGVTDIDRLTTTWQDNSNNESDFDVQYKQTGNCADADGWSSAPSQAANATSYQRTGLTANNQYCFKLSGSTGTYDAPWDSGGPKYTMIEAPLGITFGAITNSTIPISATGSFTNLNAGSSGLRFTETTGGGGGEACFGWGQTNSCTDGSLAVDTRYTYKAQARNGDGLTTAETGTANKFTLANQPDFATLSANSTTAIDLSVNKSGNPEGGGNANNTPYAIYNQDLGKWLGTDGIADENAEVWATYSEWGSAGGLTNTGLAGPNEEINYQIKARNGDSVETAESNGSRYTHIETPTNIDFDDIQTDSITISGDTDFSNLGAGSSRVVYDFISSPTGGAGGDDSGDFHANPYEDSGLDANDQYCYKVRAFNGNNVASTADFVPVANACRYTLALSPDNESAAGNYNETDSYLTDVAWGLNGASKVRVVRDGDTKYEGALEDYKEDSLLPNTSYSYDLYSLNGDDAVNPSKVTVSDTTPPDKPINLSATDITPGTATNLWDSVPAVGAYEICYGTNDDGADNFGCFDAGASESYAVNGLDAGTTYYYKTRAANANGTGAWSHGTGAWSTPPPYPSFTTTSANKLLVKLPGQTFTNGVGVTGIPDDQDAGLQFTVTVYAVDNNNFVDHSRNGLTNISSSDSQATLPANDNLVNGIKSFLITLKTAGIQSVTGSYVPGGVASGSQLVNVVAGNISGLRSYIIVDPVELPVHDSSKVTVGLRDAYNNALSGYALRISTNNSDDVTYENDNRTTNSSGEVVSHIKSDQAHTSTITVIVTNAGNYELPIHPQITWSYDSAIGAVITGPTKAIVGTNVQFSGRYSIGNIRTYLWDTSDVYYRSVDSPFNINVQTPTQGNGVTFQVKSGKTVGTEEQISASANDSSQTGTQLGVSEISAQTTSTEQLKKEAQEITTKQKNPVVRAVNFVTDTVGGFIQNAGKKVSNWLGGLFSSSENLQSRVFHKVFAQGSDSELNRTFSETGYYDISLEVTATDGRKDTAYHQILIVPPAPVITDVVRSGDKIIFSGTAWPDINVQLFFSPSLSSGATGKTRSTFAGLWSYSAPADQFAVGEYLVYGIAVDDHDIPSDPSNEVKFQITLNGDVVIVTPIPEGSWLAKVMSIIRRLGAILSILTLALGLSSVLLGINFFNILPYLYYIFTMLMEKLGIVKRREPWGIVYDSRSKSPVELAIVRIFDVKHNKLLETRVTSKDGKFGFLVPPGTYKITITKYGYRFASQIVKPGTKSDDVYSNIYHGAAFAITPEKRLVNYNVPVDPMSSTEEKKQTIWHRIWVFVILSRVYVKKIIIPLLILAILVALFTYFVGGEKIDLFISAIMVVLLFWEIYDRRAGRNWGVVYDTKTKEPIAGALVKIFDEEYHKQKESKATDKQGRFGFIVPPGRYSIEVEKKGYRFPSTKIRRKNDGKYHFIYHGEIVRKNPKDSIIAMNIPIDPEE